MKKMNLAVVLMMVAVSAWAGGLGIVAVDPERVADGFAQTDISQYEGMFGFTRVMPDGSSSYVEGNFTMLLDGRIQRLVIDGVEIMNWEDEPLGGLPVNKVGSATWFWLNLSAWDGMAGRWVAYGGMSDELLLPTDSIAVELSLADEQRFVPFDASLYAVDPSQLSLRLAGGNGTEWSYDASRGGFDIWFDPSRGVSYEIINGANGQVIARGDIEDGMAEANIVNITMAGGVRNLIPAGQESASWEGQWPTNWIIRDGQWLATQIYVARAYDNMLSLYLNGLPNGVVEVYSVDSGERVLVSQTEVKSENTYIAIPAGYDRLVIEVLSPEWASFNIWAYRGGYGKG